MGETAYWRCSGSKTGQRGGLGGWLLRFQFLPRFERLSSLLGFLNLGHHRRRRCAYMSPALTLAFDGRIESLVEARQHGVFFQTGLVGAKVLVESLFEVQFEQFVVAMGLRQRWLVPKRRYQS